MTLSYDPSFDDTTSSAALPPPYSDLNPSSGVPPPVPHQNPIPRSHFHAAQRLAPHQTPAPRPHVVSQDGPAAKPDFPPEMDNSRMTLKPWKKRSMTILLIGETGVGKTAFLDLLGNVCAGRTLEDFAAVHVKGNEAGGSASGSQTNEPKLYTITCANGYEVRILDTPGLADTRGIEYDNKHKAAIAEAIRDKTETIDSVIVLANGTQERLGVATDYALTVIAGMFPNSIVDNIGFLFTMVANPLQFNFKREALHPSLRKAKIWAIDNPLAGWLKYLANLGSQDFIDEEMLVEMSEVVNLTYTKTLKTLSAFFKWQDEREVQPVKAINDLYQMSMKIEASISNILARMDQQEDQMRNLVKIQNDIDKQKQIQKVNEEFRTVMKKPFHEHQSTSKHNTLCVAGNCYENCHVGCHVPFTLDRSVLGTHCRAFGTFRASDGGYICDECGHSSLLHQHYKSQWVEREKTETLEDAEAKSRYQRATSEVERIAILRDELNKRVALLRRTMNEDEAELSRLCSAYNKLALSGSFSGSIAQAIRLLTLRYEKMKKEGADSDALARMSERIKSLEKKKRIVEEVTKSKMVKVDVQRPIVEETTKGKTVLRKPIEVTRSKTVNVDGMFNKFAAFVGMSK